MARPSLLGRFRRKEPATAGARPAGPPRRALPHPGQLRRERRALLRVREERLRDLGGLMLEMFRRDQFRQDLLVERCDELLASTSASRSSTRCLRRRRPRGARLRLRGARAARRSSGARTSAPTAGGRPARHRPSCRAPSAARQWLPTRSSARSAAKLSRASSSRHCRRRRRTAGSSERAGAAACRTGLPSLRHPSRPGPGVLPRVRLPAAAGTRRARAALCRLAGPLRLVPR